MRTKNGEANVTERMVLDRAVIGGEGNGGVIYPSINFARDSQVGMALILHLLASSGKTVSGLVADLPRFVMVKEKSPAADYTVFVHIYNEREERVFQDDFLTTPPTSAWWPGDSVWQERTLSVPGGMEPGEYRVYTGMYLLATMERLPISGQPSSDDSLFLTTLQVDE